MITVRLNRAILLALLFLLFQTAILPWLIPSAWSSRLLPNLPFLLTLFVALYGGRHRGFVFGLGFGLLEDILFNGNMVGGYAFGMALLGYLIGLATEGRNLSLVLVLTFIGVGNGLLDLLVYFIYKLFLLTHLSVGYVAYWQIIPTLLLQVLAGLILYLPVRRWLLKNVNPSAEEKTV